MDHTDPKQNWGAEPSRAPTPEATDKVIFSECGRVLYSKGSNAASARGVDYRSHWFMLVKASYGYYILVKHGGGQERARVGHVQGELLVNALGQLPSDARYYLLHELFNVGRDAERFGAEQAAHKYITACKEGRLHRRKVRGRNEYVVTIDPKVEG